MRFKVLIELGHESGPEQTEEVMLDAFAAAVGQQNGSPRPLVIKAGVPADLGGAGESVYVVTLVDDA